MNAHEVIEQIQQLPFEEQGKVVEFVRHLPNEETLAAIEEPTEGLPRYRSMDEVRNALKGLLEDA